MLTGILNALLWAVVYVLAGIWVAMILLLSVPHMVRVGWKKLRGKEG